MKRILCILTLLLSSSFLSFTTNAQDLSGSITIWCWGQTVKPLKYAANNFMKEHPNTKIKISSVGFQGALKKISTGLMSRGRGLPDISLVDDRSFNGFISLYPSQFVNLSKKGYDKYRKDFPQYKLDTITYKKDLYAFPFGQAPVVIFYRRSVFEQSGVNPDNINTWDDYINAGIKIKEKTGKFMFDFSDDAYMFSTIMQQSGIGFFDKNGNIDILNPKAIEALTLLKRMMDKGIIYKTSPGSVLRNIAAGEIVAIPTGAWMAANIKSIAPESKGDWGVIKLPASEGQVHASVNGGASLAIFKSSKNIDLAYKFMEYFSTNVNNQVAILKSGALSTFIPAFSEPAFTKKDEFFGGQPIWTIISETTKDIIYVNVTKDHIYTMEAGLKAMQNVLLNGISPKKALQQLADDLARRTNRKINHY